jgi:hypothetical protein
MIYSRWRPSDGKYEYFETPEKFGLGDDMPVPNVPLTASPIGISSVIVGRKPSGPIRRVGEGEAPIGAIMPTATADLGFIASRDAMMLIVALLSGIVIGSLMKGDGRAGN